MSLLFSSGLLSLVLAANALPDGPNISPGARMYLRRYQTTYSRKINGGAAASPSDLARLPTSPDDDTEWPRNRGLVDLFESDIVLSEAQAKALYNGLASEGGGRRTRRAVVAASRSKWASTTIPYSFGFSGDNSRREGILAGLRQWDESTCLRFTERSSSSSPSLRFIVGSGCYSSVGAVGRRGQEVSIGRGCESAGIVAHEVGHALGFWHEQSRPDRDGSLRVNFGNILSGTESNFERQRTGNTNDLGVALDIGSVMMYSTGAFSKNGRPTLEAIDPDYANTFGNRAAVSFTDVKQMNRLYCQGTCRTNLGCLHGGYSDPKDCSRCRCPDGLGGDKCERAAHSRGCGGTLTAGAVWQSIQASSDCNWLIQANGGTVELELLQMSYRARSTCTSFVEVKASRDFEVAGPRFCGVGRTALRSATSQLVLMSRGSGSFSARFRAVGGAPGPIVTPQPVVTTARPIFPTPPPPPTSEEWGTWTPCSAACGGCGLRSRERTVNGRQTRQKETRSCNKQPCQGTNQAVANDESAVEVDSTKERHQRRRSTLDHGRSSGFCCVGFRIRRRRCHRNG